LESHHERLLTLAGEAWDEAASAREEVRKAGEYFVNKNGEIRPHPGIGVARDATIRFARLLRDLDLDAEPPKESRPPLLRRYRNA